jgi:hypothetical protein
MMGCGFMRHTALERIWGRAGRILAVLALAAGLGACAGGWSGSAGEAPQSPPYAGIALPDGYNIDGGETVVLGEGDRWNGRLVYTIGSSATDMFDFYRRQMPQFGWTEVSLVRADTSVLTFSSQGTNRIANVSIKNRRFPPWGSIVSVVVAPIGAGPPSAMPRS